MFGKPSTSIVLKKNNTVAYLQQVVRVSILPRQCAKGQILPQKLYNSGF